VNDWDVRSRRVQVMRSMRQAFSYKSCRVLEELC
jgi:hypothetical protein